LGRKLSCPASGKGGIAAKVQSRGDDIAVDDLVHQTQRLGTRSLDGLPREHDLQRRTGADQAGKPLGASSAGHKSQRNFGQAQRAARCATR
jgi:hypothetical protein